MIHTVMWNDIRTIVVSYFDENGMIRQDHFSFFQIGPSKFMLMCLNTKNRVFEKVYKSGEEVDFDEIFKDFYSDTETFTVELIEK